MNTTTTVNGNKDAQNFAVSTGTTVFVDCKVRVLTFIQNSFLASAMVVASTNFAFAQTGKLYLKDETKITTTIDMVTSQYGDGTEDKKHITAAPAKEEASAAADKNATASAPFGDDKYLKTKETGKKYTEFQVLAVNNLDKDAVMRGLMTGSLDRDTRYNDKGAPATKTSVTVINGTVDQKDAKGNVAKNAGKVNVAAISFKDKVFVIAGKNDYRYMDGKRIVGGQKLIDELMKGKPVTEATFYFELKKAGIIKDATTLTQFSKMDLNQQQLMLNGIAVAAAF